MEKASLPNDSYKATYLKSRSVEALSGALDEWIRGAFVELNCTLEDLYWEQDDRNNVEGIGDETKNRLLTEGRDLIAPLLANWNPNCSPEEAYYLLGNVGYYMGACRRHEITHELRETESPLIEASALATKLSLLLGVTPRLVTSQMQYLNLAKNGDDRSFTRRKDEVFFIQCNSMAQLNYMQAADALSRIAPLGLSHPLSLQLLEHAETALERIEASNFELFKDLDVDRFYYCVRPYVKSYHVGRQVWRGANAGDLSATAEVDLRLGLCSGSDPFYLGVLAEKAPYMIASDQPRIASALRCRPLLDQLMEGDAANETWVKPAAKAMLPVYDRVAKIAVQHHKMLVGKFIKKPTKKLLERHMETLTASGMEFKALILDLQRICDLRTGEKNDEIGSRHADLQRLRDLSAG